MFEQARRPLVNWHPTSSFTFSDPAGGLNDSCTLRHGFVLVLVLAVHLECCLLLTLLDRNRAGGFDIAARGGIPTGRMLEAVIPAYVIEVLRCFSRGLPTIGWTG
jgi:hypothetical protein